MLHDPDMPLIVRNHDLSVVGIAQLIDTLLEEQKGVRTTRAEVDRQLKQLALRGDELRSCIKVSGMNERDDNRLRQMLEKLDLALGGEGKPGLGSNNLLFMACELLLLVEGEGNRLLLIEEPASHVHPQRQLRAMTFLQKQAEEKGVQVIVTTHSPNLASAINLENIVMIRSGRAFSMAKGQTELESSDYRFLQRFLDVTKANLFFARGVIIVEGDAENILLPTLARLIGRDFTENGVSIVNVGGVGLRRYARIFQRKNIDDDGPLGIPIACVTDMDVMPKCAGAITGKTLHTKVDLGPQGLVARRNELFLKTNGQGVQTFVADEWTLEYDLAYSGLAEDLYIAARLAEKDEALARQGRDLDDTLRNVEIEAAITEFQKLQETAREHINKAAADGCSYEEVLAAHVYARFTKGSTASKPIAAQYLANRLEDQQQQDAATDDDWKSRLPQYLVDAIEYVTTVAIMDEHLQVRGAVVDE